MTFVSVTRLHLRSVRFLPSFLYYAMASVRQLRGAPGYVGGWTGSEGLRGFWTATCWTDLASMRAYRNAEPHLTAMRKLLHWCDEASYGHWEQDSAQVPDGAAAFRRLAEAGATSKVAHPSARHRAGKAVGDRIPRHGGNLSPRGR